MARSWSNYAVDKELDLQKFNKGWLRRKNQDRDRTDRRLHAIATALEQMEGAQTLTETLALTADTIIANFGISGLAVALRNGQGTTCRAAGLHGLPEELGEFPIDSLDAFSTDTRVKRSIAFDARMHSLLPHLTATTCNIFPLQSLEGDLGFFMVTDSRLSKGEIMMISMVAHAAAAKFARILKDAEYEKSSALSQKLISLANTLLDLDGKDELYPAVLRIASDLVEASQGSVMLVDPGGLTLQIACSEGLPASLARDVTVEVGSGIAGTVAGNGEPLLIGDIEQDLRVGSRMRPRYRSKSLVSVPLKVKDRVIGVLNLTDKKSLAPFTETDLETLSSFANLASLMIERVSMLEKSTRFEMLSVTDALTGLYNRRFLKSRLEEEISRSKRQALSLTVLFIDLDGFKRFNDLCGHLAGDDALKKVAEIIKTTLREMDVVARYGGEEFCAILPDTGKGEASIVAERIRKGIEQEIFNNGTLAVSTLTASLGIASFPEDGTSFTTLLHAADMALYRAKAGGRNRVMTALKENEEPPQGFRPRQQIIGV